MAKKLLDWDETLFKDPEVFDIGYVPEQFYYRDAQTESLLMSIRPALRGGKIVPTVCRGVPGTGKTTTVRKIFEDIEENTKKIIPISVNCQIDNSEYAVFSRIYTKLTKQSAPRTGTSFNAVLDSLVKYLEKEDIVPLVCLDDANYLVYQKQFNDVLYPLLRIHEQCEGLSFGVIAVFSDMSIDLENVTDARVRSVFRYETVEFLPYTRSEVAEILLTRVNSGLYPGVMPSEIFDEIVEYTMHLGDIRAGLDLIKRSVLYTENEARTRVTRTDLSKAVSTSRDRYIMDLVKSLCEDEILVLSKIVRLTSDDGNKSPTTSEIRDAIPKTGPKVTRVNEIIEKFELMGLVTTEYANVGKGRQRFVHSKYDKERMKNIIARRKNK